MVEFKLRKAVIDDLEQIQKVQRAAFMSEAVSLNDFSISPLNQTLESIHEDFLTSEIIVAANEQGDVVGSIRGKRGEEGTLIFKLTVDPLYQKNGIGKSLICAMEKALPASRYYLFTSSKNTGALDLYGKLGYVKYKEEQYSPTLRFYHLEKIITSEHEFGGQ